VISDAATVTSDGSASLHFQMRHLPTCSTIHSLIAWRPQTSSSKIIMDMREWCPLLGNLNIAIHFMTNMTDKHNCNDTKWSWLNVSCASPFGNRKLRHWLTDSLGNVFFFTHSL